MSSSSYRIGRRRTAVATTCSPESGVLRSLFDLRKRCNDPSCATSRQQVTEITFFNCEWTQRIINSLSKLIVRDGHRFSSIKFFDCDFSSPKFAEIISMIMSHNTTTKLVLKGRKLVGNLNESNEQFLPRCDSSIATSSVGEPFLGAIRDGISTKTSLRSLKLSGLRIAYNSDNDDDHLWCHSLINNGSLLNLDLSDSYLSTSTISSLSSALSLNTTLQSLNFGGCFLDDQSLSQIIQSVKEHPSLIKLNLSRNFLARSTSTKALDAVAELLKSKDCKLEFLDLSNQQHPVTKTLTNDKEIGSEEKEREERLKIAFMNALDALSANTTLRSINLSGNSGCFLDLDYVKALSSCLVTNTSLFHADISTCHLNPHGLIFLSQHCIPRCSGNLKTLVLLDDEISNKSTTDKENWATAFLSLERGLQSNSTLESLGELDNTVMNCKSRSSLQYLLSANRAGRRALEAYDLPLATWSEILARVNRIGYEIHHDDKNDDENSNEVGTSHCSITSASILFTLLHGPVMLEK